MSLEDKALPVKMTLETFYPNSVEGSCTGACIQTLKVLQCCGL